MSHHHAFFCYGGCVSRHIWSVSGWVYPLNSFNWKTANYEWMNGDNDDMRVEWSEVEQYKRTLNCSNYLSSNIHVYYMYNYKLFIAVLPSLILLL